MLHKKNVQIESLIFLYFNRFKIGLFNFPSSEIFPWSGMHIPPYLHPDLTYLVPKNPDPNRVTVF